MAICGTCNNVVPRNWRKKIDRTVSGVCFRRLLSEYFDYSPQNPVVCLQCDHVLEQIVKLNLKLEKLTIQRNTIISDFGAKISHTKVLSEDGLNKAPEQVSSKQSSNAVKAAPEDGSQTQTPALGQSSSQPVFPEMKVEPLEEEAEDGHFSDLAPSKKSHEESELPPARRTRQSSRRQRNQPTTNIPLQPVLQQEDEDDASNINNNNDDDEEEEDEDSDDNNNSDAAGPDDDDDDSNSIRDPPPPPLPPPPTVDVKAEAEVNGDAYVYSQSQHAEPFHCALCKRKFATAEGLSRHMDTLHRAKLRKTAQCGKCLKRCRDTAALVAHLEEFHAPSSKRCMVCGKVCSDKFNYLAHMKVHRLNHEKVTGCTTCSLVFPTAEELQAHRKKQHSRGAAGRTFLCEWCSKTFNNRSNFICHTRTHTGEKPYKCEFCPSAFMESTKLKIHLAKHSGEKAFACDKCPKSFPYRSGLVTHMKIHTGEKRHKCEQCPAAFLLPLGLRNHIRSIHSDARPFVCEQCQASFKHPSHLKRHKLLHSGEKPFKCELCPATFIQKGNMKIHMKVHEKDGGSNYNPRVGNGGGCGGGDSGRVEPVPSSLSLSATTAAPVAASRKRVVERSYPLPVSGGISSGPSMAAGTTVVDGSYNPAVGGNPTDQPVMGYFPHMMSMGMFLPHHNNTPYPHPQQ